MDAVYVNRDGDNPELRYSLRSLRNVRHGKVWVFGGAPIWLNSEEVHYRKNAQRSSAYLSTRAHLEAACKYEAVSDPFTLWNDDFFAMRYVGKIPLMHRGSLRAAVETTAHANLPWVKGMRETALMLENKGFKDPMSYDGHVPLVVHKEAMLEALQWAKQAKTDAVHVRTLYGNLVDAPAEFHPDPKMLRKTDEFPAGAWLSSGDNTFRPTIEPVLRYTFPLSTKYELH